MRVKLFYILFLILLSISVLADDPLYVYDAVCEKDGSLVLSFGREAGKKIYTKDIDVKAEYIGVIVEQQEFDVGGEWNDDFIMEGSSDKTTFTSEEIMFKLRGEYIILVDYMYNDNSYTTSHKIKCPGFEFSCKLLGVYIDYCRNVNNERFEASVRIYGLGYVTKENLSLDRNIEFRIQTEDDYEDDREKFSDRGSLPKNIEISNPEYGQYYFNISWDNKIKSFVAKIVGINYIESGCVNYPGISLYDYKECEDVIIEEKEEIIEEEVIEQQENMTKQLEESEQLYTGQVVKDLDVIKELERSIGTKTVKKNKWPLITLSMILGLCIMGITYIVLKRNFNKETDW